VVLDNGPEHLLNNWLVKLTNRLVKAGRGGAGRRRGPADGQSRERIFAAATAEFAAKGFAGASVDRIAATAHLNKAMIYYHFGSKAGLYREILRDMFGAVGGRLSAIAGSDLSPADKVREFVQAIALEAEARPHFPPIWFREVAEGGSHLDAATLGDMLGILTSVTSIVGEGVRTGRFNPINPLLVHAGIVAPVLLFFATAGIRRRIERAGLRGAGRIDRDEMVAHTQRVALGLLEGRMA
jgi:AcrR family transcriptional regulator